MRLFSISVLAIKLSSEELSYQLITGFRSGDTLQDVSDAIITEAMRKYPDYRIEKVGLTEITRDDMLMCLSSGSGDTPLS